MLHDTFAVPFAEIAPIRDAQAALVDGTLGAVVTTDGQPTLALTFTVRNDEISQFEIIGNPACLRQLHLALLDSW